MHQGREVVTAIFKEPVSGPLQVGKRLIAGDQQADLRHHGGESKAVYCYPWEHYATWREELGRDDFTPGQFGENFTAEGLLESAVCIGDQLVIGTARFEVTQPRVPCMKLGIRMKDPSFVKRFLNSRRSGFSMRVLEPGVVSPGDEIAISFLEPARVTVEEINTLRFFDTGNEAGIRRALAVGALSPEWRADLNELLPTAR